MLGAPAIAAVLLSALIAVGPAPVTAGEVQERLFQDAVLDFLGAEEHLVFRHDRSGTLLGNQLAAIEGGEIDVSVGDGTGGAREARVSLTGAQGRPATAVLSALAGHPVLIVFLENTARNMAALTGGSPFYIRNRMREALASEDAAAPVRLAIAGAEIEASEVTLRPFAEDPNRERMGPFADLTLRIALSDAVPGGFARFEATTGAAGDAAPGYAETIVFQTVEEE
jgi:hypothetical protein